MLVMDLRLGNEFIRNVEVIAAPGRVVQATDKSFIGFGGHRPPILNRPHRWDDAGGETFAWACVPE